MHWIYTSFLFAALCVPVSAIECKSHIFIPAIEAINKTVSELEHSSVTHKTMNLLKKTQISRKNYKKEMKILDEKLVLLNNKKGHALKAKNLNDKNLNLWISLEKSCQGKDKLIAIDIENDVQSLQRDIDQRIETINYYIKLVKITIAVGKKYQP